MKTYLLAFLLLAFFTSRSQDIKKVKIGELAALIKKSDHPLVVSFWATWCAPCIEEIPDLQAAAKVFSTDSVELVLVSLDFASFYPKKINEFVSKKNFQASLYWLNETDADEFCPKIDEKWSGAIPATLFVNNRTQYRKFFERQLKKEEINEEVKRLVNN